MCRSYNQFCPVTCDDFSCHRSHCWCNGVSALPGAGVVTSNDLDTDQKHCSRPETASKATKTTCASSSSARLLSRSCSTDDLRLFSDILLRDPRSARMIDCGDSCSGNDDLLSTTLEITAVTFPRNLSQDRIRYAAY